MKNITDEQIIAIARKYRKELFENSDKTLCVKHFNETCKCNMPENTPFVENGFCIICQEYKPCVSLEKFKKIK